MLWAFVLTTTLPTHKDRVVVHHHVVQHHHARPAAAYSLMPIAVGIASWYGPGFQGLPTASAKPFNTNQPMCAMRHVPLGTPVLVQNHHTKKVAWCRIVDRGPYVGNRVIDLSHEVKQQLGMGGLAPVTVYRVSYPHCSHSVANRSEEAGQPRKEQDIKKKPDPLWDKAFPYVAWV